MTPRWMFPLGHAGITLAAWRLRGGRLDPEPLDVPLWALLGAVLPDLVDKPVALFLLDGGSGRLLAHTALFAVAWAAAWTLLRRRGPPTAAGPAGAVAFGVGAHLVLDRVFLDPRVLLWPAYGLGFPSGTTTAAAWVDVLLTDPATYVPEVLGGAYLAWEAARWARARRAAAPA